VGYFHKLFVGLILVSDLGGIKTLGQQHVGVNNTLSPPPLVGGACPSRNLQPSITRRVGGGGAAAAGGGG